MLVLQLLMRYDVSQLAAADEVRLDVIAEMQQQHEANWLHHRLDSAE